jgi:hypothetical protein
MEITVKTNRQSNYTEVHMDQKNKIAAPYLEAFLEECRIQKQFFSGQMPIEEYIGLKKKAPK